MRSEDWDRKQSNDLCCEKNEIYRLVIAAVQGPVLGLNGVWWVKVFLPQLPSFGGKVVFVTILGV